MIRSYIEIHPISPAQYKLMCPDTDLPGCEYYPAQQRALLHESYAIVALGRLGTEDSLRLASAIFQMDPDFQCQSTNTLHCAKVAIRAETSDQTDGNNTAIGRCVQALCKWLCRCLSWCHSVKRWMSQSLTIAPQLVTGKNTKNFYQYRQAPGPRTSTHQFMSQDRLNTTFQKRQRAMQSRVDAKRTQLQRTSL